MKIVLIDHQVLFRQGLASLLNNQPGIEVIGEVDSLAAALESIAAGRPDLVIIDPCLPNADCADVIRAITDASPATKVLVLTANISDQLLFGSIRAGACGCLFKDTPIAKLTAALNAIKRGEPAISSGMMARIIEEFRRLDHSVVAPGDLLGQLTDREIEILAQLGQNASNEEIAAMLMISENTVKVHVHNIIKKLKIRNRREAALLAQKSRLVRPQDEIAIAAWPNAVWLGKE